MAKQENANTSMILFAIFLILLLVFGWHFVAPVLGLAVVGSIAGLWSLGSAIIVGLCVITLLAFLLSGAWLLIISILGFLITLTGIILFPFLFPILIPIFIIMTIVSKFCKKRSTKKKGIKHD